MSPTSPPPEDEAPAAAAPAEISAPAIKWPDPTLFLELRTPVENADGTPVTVLQLREPTGAEWDEILAHPDASRRRFGVSKVSGLPMATVGKIGIGDLLVAEDYMLSFFDIGQEIAARSRPNSR